MDKSVSLAARRRGRATGGDAGCQARSWGIRRAIIVRAVALLLSLAACSVFPDRQEIAVLLPSLPGLWIDCGIDPVWEIHAFWADGEVDVARPGASATLSLPRDRTCAVLAWPVQGGRRLRPAGAVYPRDGSVTLSLSWEGGYRAEAARVLIRAGMDPARFDLERLVREARVRLGDPWLKPPETFAGRFARGEFRADWLDPPPLYAAAVSGFPGPAASESPFGTCLVPDGEGRAEATLPAGFHAWHAFWGRASADVREDGGSAWVVVRRK